MADEFHLNSINNRQELHRQGRGKKNSSSFVTADPDMCYVQHCVGHNHMFFFVLWIGHQVHRRSDHAATRRLRSGYPVVRCFLL